ncbi:endonuclease [Ruania suaedae]|uniref:endonuclease n=1 Tax=Ruania suaedae TaxID=2897774 RepID=UPI001E35C823|nr:endonuclease [Ruania suaedae]UFU04050.1 endonuclease [Ruania suaedae]
MTQRRTAEVLLQRHGQTYAAQAHITLKDTPSPLYRLLVLSLLLSAPISGDIAVRAAQALSRAGYRTPQRMVEATWQQRVDALGEGGYRRYDESTATTLGKGAHLLLDRHRGDLRRLRDEAKDAAQIHEALQQFPGIGSVGATIFCREAQGVWPALAPFVDEKVLDGAAKVGLPDEAERLVRLVSSEALPQLAAACVRASLSDDVVEDVRRHAD